MNRRVLTGSLLVMLVGALATSAQDKKQEELNWAKTVAEDFLSALARQEEANMVTLLTADYAKLLAMHDRFGQDAASALINKAGGKGGALQKALITLESISPDQDEAQFKGTLERESGSREFSIRVVKEKELNRWRVCILTVAEEKPRAPAKP